LFHFNLHLLRSISHVYMYNFRNHNTGGDVYINTEWHALILHKYLTKKLVSTKHTDNCIHLQLFVKKYEFMLQHSQLSCTWRPFCHTSGLVLFIISTRGQIDTDAFWGKVVEWTDWYALFNYLNCMFVLWMKYYEIFILYWNHLMNIPKYFGTH
jgi:hypothetical protein